MKVKRDYKTPEWRDYFRKYRQRNLRHRRKIEMKSYKKRYGTIGKKRDYTSQKLIARGLLTQAVFYKKIIKPACCDGCGKKMARRLIHGHHKDYTKPYEVEWLCSICHGIKHRKN